MTVRRVLELTAVGLIFVVAAVAVFVISVIICVVV